MAEKPGSEPAYPIIEQWVDELGEGRNRLHSPGLSIRQHAAIQLRVPESDEPWLNDMIRRARRADMTQAVAQGLMANPYCKRDAPGLSGLVIEYVDAILKLEAETRKEKSNA